MTEMYYYKEALKLNRGNIGVHRKLADLQRQSEDFLAAALSYEKIRDFISAEQCFEQANATAESHEKIADYLVRTNLTADDLAQAGANYKKAISHYSLEEKEVDIARVYGKLARYEEVAALVKNNFNKLNKTVALIFPQAKIIKNKSLNFEDGQINYDEIEEEPQGQSIEGLSRDD